MSDIKQAMLDELESLMYGSHHSSGYYQMYNDAMKLASKVVAGHLEGMTIVPDEISKAVDSVINNGVGIMKDGKFVELKDFYKEPEQ